MLPFVNMSRDEENEYFADGLAEELLNVLAKIRGLRVAARSSAFTFKGKGATVAEVGRALNVATVLEGSVRKAGNRMRISVQLVKVVDGYQLWSETYDRTLEDIFAVQDDIAQSVVKELRTTLLGEAADAQAGKEATAEVAAAVKGRSTDPEAHRLFLQARHFIDRSTREDTAKGIGYLKEALALEPEFALAWAELGRAYASEANWGWAPAAEGLRGVRGRRRRERLRWSRIWRRATRGWGGSRCPMTGTGAVRRRRIAARWNWRREMRWCFTRRASWRGTWAASRRRSGSGAARWSRIR